MKKGKDVDMNKYLVFSEEVNKAIKQNKPIVALESTIISHGMPYPQNVETAREVEEIVRENGATPATIAIMDGKIKIGLSEDELELFGKSENVEKVSRRDLPQVIATKKLGATTVATTMICAELAGIYIFATGGIGGVHRGAEVAMDIAAGVEELSRSNVDFVCAGATLLLSLDIE